MLSLLTAATPSDRPADGIAGWAVDLMEALGAAGAGAAIALENLFPPIPSEAVLPLAGFAAGRGEFSLAEALLWTTAGSLVGALVLYAIGRAIGPDRIRAIIDRAPLMKVRDLDRTEAWFERHGTKAVLFGRMVPLFRSLVSVPAGVTRMSATLFAALTLAGSLAWNALFVLAGYSLGDQWHRVEPYADTAQKAVIVLVALGLIYFLITRLRSRLRPAV